MSRFGLKERARGTQRGLGGAQKKGSFCDDGHEQAVEPSDIDFCNMHSELWCFVAVNNASRESRDS